MKALEIKKLVKIRFNLLNEHFFPPVFFESISVGMFSIFLAVYFLQVHLSNLYIPFSYRGDSYFIILIIKSILDNGWYFHNSYLGAPFGLENYDFPIPDGGMLILIKIIGYFYPNPWFIHNVIYLGSFFIVAAVSYIILYKELNINKNLSFSGAILFTFLPFHFFRLPHLFYTWYFTIPIYISLCIKIMYDKNKNKDNPIISLKDIFLLMFCASFGIYFSFFASILFIFSAIYLFQSNQYRQFKRPIIFISIIYATLALNLLPNILYKTLTPPNTEVAIRNPAESEVYGLRITQLVLPSAVHRINWLAEKTLSYNKVAPVVNENTTATLGFVGSIGFAILLINIFIKERMLSKIQIISQLANLNLACLLLGTIGGLGSLFAFLISPMIRSYNRISVFIAFLSITSVLIVLQKIIDDRKFKNPSLVYKIITVLIVLIGFFDQTSPTFIPNYAVIKQEYENDSRFIHKVEMSVPPGTLIYQLPYIGFPEKPPLYQEGHYGLIRAYLHSKALKWSYGAMKGCEGDFWLKTVSSLPIKEQVQKISASGFGGIYIDRRGFEDHAVELEDQLKLLTFTNPIVSEDNNLAFYRIQPDENTPAIVPISFSLGKGFFGWEGGEGTFTWSTSRNAELWLNNPNKDSLHAKLHFEINTLLARNVVISVNYNSNNTEFYLKPGEPQSVNLILNLIPGRTKLKFKTDTPAQLPGNGDTRKLAFSITNLDFQLTD